MNPLFIQNKIQSQYFKAGDIYLIRLFGQKCQVVVLTIINEVTIWD